MTSSTFDKLIAQQQGNLPDTGSPYHELEKGDLKYDGLDLINKGIDASIADFQEKTKRDIIESQRFHKQKEQNLESLVGLIGTAAKFKEWEESRKYAESIFDRYYTNTFDDVGDPKSDVNANEEAKAFIEKQTKALVEQRIVTKNTHDIITTGLATGDVATEEGIAGLSESKVQRENISGFEAGNQYVEGWQPFFGAEIYVKKRLRNSRTGEEMPYAMSYMEVLESDNREIKQFLPWLYRDIYSDYHAANKDLVERMGDRHFRYKVFPSISETGGQLHQKLLERQLNQSIINSEEKINESILTEFNSHLGGTEDPETKNQAVINYLFGDNGLLASKEVGADGTKDNQRGWKETADWLVWAIEKERIDPDVAQAIIDSDKIPKRDGSGNTSLDDLKNPNADSFKRRVKTAIGIAENKQTRADTAIENAYVTDLSNDGAEELRTEFKDKPIPINRINEARQKVIEAAKAEGYHITELHPSLAVFNTLESELDSNEKQARESLNRSVTAGRPLTKEYIDLIPATGAADGRNRSFYEEYAAREGIYGLTDEEETQKHNEVVYHLTKGGGAFLNPLEANTITGQYYIQRGKDLYQAAYEAEMARVLGQNPNLSGQAYKDAKFNARQLAAQQVAKLIKERKDAGKDETKIAETEFPILDKAKASQGLKETAQIVQKINKEGENALLYEYYYPGEEEAIMEYLEWKKNPAGQAPNGYWRAHQGHFRANLSGNEKPNSMTIMDRRVAATSHLRDGGEEENKEANVDHPKSNSNATVADHDKTGDDSKLCQAVFEPGVADTMLEDMKHKDRDVNSVYNATQASMSKVFIDEKLDNEVYGGKPLSQSTVGEVVVTSNLSDKNAVELRFGIYDIPGHIIYEMMRDGIIDKDAVFDENLQKQIVIRRIISRNNQSSNKTYYNGYKRGTWLSQKEIEQFNKIVSNTIGTKNDPYNEDLSLLSPACAKALIGSIRGEEIPTE